MKILKVASIAAILFFGSTVSGMAQDGWALSLLNIGQQTRTAVARAFHEVQELFREKRVGDFFTRLPSDVQRLLWQYFLSQYCIEYRIRRVLRLRGICKAWNEMLHEEHILNAIFPEFYFKGGTGDVLLMTSITTEGRFVLWAMGHCSALMKLSLLQPMRGLLEQRGQSRSRLLENKKNLILQDNVSVLTRQGPGLGGRVRWCKLLAYYLNVHLHDMPTWELKKILVNQSYKNEKFVWPFHQVDHAIVLIRQSDEYFISHPEQLREMLQVLSKDTLFILDCPPQEWLNKDNFVSTCSIIRFDDNPLIQQEMILWPFQGWWYEETVEERLGLTH